LQSSLLNFPYNIRAECLIQCVYMINCEFLILNWVNLKVCYFRSS
jgi:hypothetical protein